MTALISCHSHDYIEIACLYRLDIKLTLQDGSLQSGTAISTLTKNRQEYLLMQSHDGEVAIALSKIKRMTALTDNPHFSLVDIA